MSKKPTYIIKTKNKGQLSYDLHRSKVQSWLDRGFLEDETWELESKRDGVINKKTKWILTSVKNKT